MIARLSSIAFNTYREAVRERVLYNLIAFALLLIGSSLLFGRISIGVEKVILINLGLTAISVFGVIIAVFIGIGLVSKDIDRRTLYTVLARPVRRWEVIVGKFLGLAGTLAINTLFMSIGLFTALLVLTRRFVHADLAIVAAIWMVLLQLFIIVAFSLLFSTFSTPILSAIFSFVIFIMGNFNDDLWAYAQGVEGAERFALRVAGVVLPNLSQMNVASRAAHGAAISANTVALATGYTAAYVAALLTLATFIFQRRSLK